MSLSKKIRSKARELGFDLVGFTPADPPTGLQVRIDVCNLARNFAHKVEAFAGLDTARRPYHECRTGLFCHPVL